MWSRSREHKQQCASNPLSPFLAIMAPTPLVQVGKHRQKVHPYGNVPHLRNVLAQPTQNTTHPWEKLQFETFCFALFSQNCSFSSPLTNILFWMYRFGAFVSELAVQNFCVRPFAS